MSEITDLEGYAKSLYLDGLPDEEVLARLGFLSPAKAMALLQEVKASHRAKQEKGLLSLLFNYPVTGLSAGDAGLGCRGASDWLIHQHIARLAGNAGVITPQDLDDGGVVLEGEGDYIVSAVDGMHSRLSDFPFLAGYHATRAALRDVIVMGARPIALMSDVHIANDGDVGKVLDHIAGIGAVGDLMHVPLITGSTLRIGGDMVAGERMTGGVGAIGCTQRITPRRAAKPEDVLVMTAGSGGGTIATTAIYNGYPQVVLRTMGLSTLKAGMRLLSLKGIHAMSDVTNGGIRGEASQMARTAGVRLVLDADRVKKLIDPPVLRMLNRLEIDPLGVSIDSLILVVQPRHVQKVIGTITDLTPAGVVGEVLPGEGAYLTSGEALCPRYREAPYTPIKRVVDREAIKMDLLKKGIQSATDAALRKKEDVKRWVVSNEV